jgi:hypothetical protein
MRPTRLSFLGIQVLALGLLTAAPVVAQDATPASTPGGPSGGFPVAVHQGTCQDPTAEPAFDIGNATGPGSTGGDVTTIGTQSGPILVKSSGEIDKKLDDLANEGNVIAVHASPDDYETLVACGQIAGVKEDGKVAIALAPVGDSTTVGVAILEEDDDKTKADVYIFDTLPPDQATPAS